jgi:hypothetical protein
MFNIINTEQTVTAYKKRISFEYEGKPYNVTLYWDENDGLELWFRGEHLSSTPAPDWAVEWNEDEHDGDSLAYLLDALTDKENN